MKYYSFKTNRARLYTVSSRISQGNTYNQYRISLSVQPLLLQWNGLLDLSFSITLKQCRPYLLRLMNTQYYKLIDINICKYLYLKMH